MFRHISVFTFHDTPEKEANIAAVRAYLDKIPALYPAIESQTVGVTLGGMPPMPDDGPVLFGDLVQICDYATAEDALGYGPSEAHGGLVAMSSAMVKKVTSIDFEV